MNRREDLLVAICAVSATLVLVAAGELRGAGGDLLKMAPLVVYFLFAAVHDPDRGGPDRLRTWLVAVGVVTLAALGWLVA